MMWLSDLITHWKKAEKKMEICPSLCLLNEMKSIKEIVEEWKDEIGIKSFQETIAIHKDGCTLYIITKSPGRFIGRHGDLVNKYKEIMRSNGHEISLISFVDLFVGNVREF